MDVEKSCFPLSSIFFAPQDSDGDKSEDNLVVDVSNEVRRQSFQMILTAPWCGCYQQVFTNAYM